MRVAQWAMGIAVLTILGATTYASVSVTRAVPAARDQHAVSAPLGVDRLDRLNHELSDGLDCEERLPILSDGSFFDPARGTDCIRSDKRGIFVRVYAHSETVPRVVQDWEPTIGEGRWFVRGANWVVFGPHDAVQMAAQMPQATTPSKVVPPFAGTTLFDQDRDTCMSRLSSAAAAVDRLPDEFEGVRDELDRDYPGAARVVEQTVTPAVIAELTGLLDYQASAMLSRFGDDYREVCRRALPER